MSNPINFDLLGLCFLPNPNPSINVSVVVRPKFEISLVDTSKFDEQPILYSIDVGSMPEMDWSPDGRFLVLRFNTVLLILDAKGNQWFIDHRFESFHHVSFLKDCIRVLGIVEGDATMFSFWTNYSDRSIFDRLKDKLEEKLPEEVVDQIMGHYHRQNNDKIIYPSKFVSPSYVYNGEEVYYYGK